MLFSRLLRNSLAPSAASSGFASLSPELQLLLACSHVSSRRQDQALPRSLIRAGIDWKYFLTLVESHQVAPAVCKNLRALADVTIPDYVLAALAQAYQQNAYNVLIQAAELARVVKQLDAAGIQHLVLKGLAVALAFYGDASLRHAGDLDLLVRETDVYRAGQVLAHLGYREVPAEQSFTPAQHYVHKKFLTHHIIFQHRSTGCILELHWRLFTNPHLLPGDPRQAFNTSYIPFGSVTLASMSVEGLIVYLCVHGDFHVWTRLKWLADLPHILEASAGLDWDKMLACATKLKVERSLYMGLFLAASLYDVELPSNVAEAMQADASLPGRTKTVYRLLTASRAVSKRSVVAEQMLIFYYLMGLRRWGRYQIHLWLSRCFNAEDWQVVRLPDALFPVYILLRPVLYVIRLRRRQRLARHP